MRFFFKYNNTGKAAALAWPPLHYKAYIAYKAYTKLAKCKKARFHATFSRFFGCSLLPLLHPNVTTFTPQFINLLKCYKLCYPFYFLYNIL